jgi:hypothetical protein
MTSINERFPRKGFLGAEDVKEGDLTLQIAGVSWDENISNGKYGDVLRFVDDGRTLTLNHTNAHAIAKLHGDNADEWHSKWVTFYFDPDVVYQGKIVGGIRVRDKKTDGNGAAKKDATAQIVKPPAPPAPPAELDDGIPF